jgi:radical SAM superfamily enzyme YgiQ (UPF0313 family)
MSSDGKIHLIKIDPKENMAHPPLGIMYVGDALKKAGFRVRLHHVSAGGTFPVGSRIVEDDPLFVGFSVLSGWGIRAAAQLSRRIRKACQAPVVWGGVHPTLLPEQCLSESYIDMVCLGEGEETAVDLARAIAHGAPLKPIAGIGFRDAAGIPRINPRRPLISDLDSYAPDWGLLGAERYLRPGLGFRRALAVIASRGCPFHCGFCVNQVLYERRWRGHSPGVVIRRLLDLKKRYSVEAFIYKDDNFFVDPDWAWQILEAVDTPYHVKLRAENIDEAFARRLSETGCREVMVGFESGSDRVLREIIQKQSTVARHMQAARILGRYPQIKLTATFIAGAPGETPEEFRQSVQLMCDLLFRHPRAVMFPAFYMPFPGTPMYRMALNSGFRPPTRTEDWEEVDNWSRHYPLTWARWISSQDVDDLREALAVLEALVRFRVPLLASRIRRQILTGSFKGPVIRILNAARHALTGGFRPVRPRLVGLATPRFLQ